MLWHNRNRLSVFAVVCCLFLLGCSQPADNRPKENPLAEPPEANPSSNETSATNIVPREGGPNDEDYPALQNLLQITDKIYCGGEPQGDDAFASLTRLGIRVIVSVDGAKPKIETARNHGLRYVHVPIGYEGVGKQAGLSLARLVRHVDGPFYFHCHHGQHRGPAAAAIACVASGDVDGKAALKILQHAGTSKGYAGLWRDVENYQSPRADVELPELVEVAEVDSFAATMARIDRAFDNLKRCRDANWAPPDDYPDLVPAQEALLLKEGLRECARNLTDDFGDEFRIRLANAESLAQRLEDSLTANNADRFAQQFRAIGKSCKQCHGKYRN